MPLNLAAGAVLAFLAAGTASPPPARWSAAPHRAVAYLAEARLTPRARAETRRLLAGATLVDVSTWPDEIRSDRPATSNWHYVNIPLADSGYRPGDHCRTGCIVRAVATQILTLRNPRRSDLDRAEALRFLVHLVGDVHNPLHVGDRGDRGGNDLVVWYRGRRTNLHSFWDSGILQASGIEEAELFSRLDHLLAAEPGLEQRTEGTVVQWALESHALSRDLAYRLLPADYRLERRYVEAALPKVEERLALAGVRLASLLNQILDPAGRVPR